jgi:hypothetical protein
MSGKSDIRHRHLLFRYRRQICRTKNCPSDIGSVTISTSESIPISDQKNFYTSWNQCRTPLSRYQSKCPFMLETCNKRCQTFVFMPVLAHTAQASVSLTKKFNIIFCLHICTCVFFICMLQQFQFCYFSSAGDK